MASNFAILLNYGGNAPNSAKVELVLNSLKDWLKFSSQNWLIYTDLSASIVRDRLIESLQPDPPSILVIPIEISKWSAYSKPLAREWLRKERDSNITGE